MPLRPRAALFASLLLAASAALCLGSWPAGAAEFIDAGGRRVLLPGHIGRILPAERNAEVLLFVLAPDRMAALSRVPGRAELLPRAGRVPVIRWQLRTDPATMAATARRLHPDLIVDAGPATPDRVAFANAVQLQSGIPYILVDDSFARIPTVLRSTAAILGDLDRGTELAIFAEHAIAGLRGRLLIRPADTRPRVYYAMGPDGLSTALPGSPAGEAIDEAGAINVARSLGRGGQALVTPGQLLAWNPEIIIAEQRSAYDQLRRSPALRSVAAVRNHRVYLEPSNPFGWIEDPSGVNRLIGLYWLSSLFYPDNTQEDLRTTACDFYDKFYEIKLTNAQLEAMLRPAGVPPPETGRPLGEPLVGLGAAPPSTLPSGTPGALTAEPPAAAASPVPGMPTLPSAAPNATCAVPTGPSPQPLPGLGAVPGVPSEAAPGVPSPGRRGRPPG